jgi:SPOR domain
MGPNSFRNLTYLAVLLVVAALIYLVYSSSKNKKSLNPSLENVSLGTYTDTLGSIIGSSTAALSMDSVKNNIDGQLLTSGAAGVAAATAVATNLAHPKGSKSEVKEVITEQPSVGGGDGDGIASSEKGKVNAKGIKKPVAAVAAPKTPVAKFDAGNGTGDFMAIAGSFASNDNANALIAKLKKIGFAKAESVKLENSANLYVVAGNYEFNGGAEAAVRTLKANKVDSYVKKRSGQVFKVAPTVTPKAAPAKAPAAKPASSFKPT